MSLPSATLVPSRRTTSGTDRFTSLAAATMPSAMMSHFMMPPKILTRMPFTAGSARMILNAAVTFSLEAPPPTSRKLAGNMPLQLDDVHRRHGEAGAVDHAANVAVELDVGEVVLARLQLRGVFLGLVAQFHEVRVAEQRVAVEADLGVEHQELAAGDGERIDLDLAGVGAEERLVERGGDLAGLLGEIAGEAERGGDAAAMVRLEAGGRDRW